MTDDGAPAGASELGRLLAETVARLHARGWALGTSGNFSAVASREPLTLVITPSGADKGELTAEDMLEVDEAGGRLRGRGRPSAETALHVAVVRVRGAGAVLHTHSVWSTLLSEAHVREDGFAIEGYEMLKGLAGVKTHDHREWVPVLPNAQDYGPLARDVEETLARHPAAHGFLLAGHGLYTWGADLAEARRHVEILEFLFEVVGRRTLPWRS